MKRTDILDYPIYEGCEIDEKAFIDFVLLHQYPDAIKKAVAMLARRACSRKEIADKLTRQGFCDDVVSLVLFKLEKNNLLNDQDFSGQWTRYRLEGKYGPGRIYRELRMKGVDEETARQAVEDIDDEDQFEPAMELAAKYFRNSKPGEDIRKVRQRILRTLVLRGFDWDTAKKAISCAENTWE